MRERELEDAVEKLEREGAEVAWAVCVSGAGGRVGGVGGGVAEGGRPGARAVVRAWGALMVWSPAQAEFEKGDG